MTLCLAVASESYGLVAFDGNTVQGGVARIADGIWMTGCGRFDVLARIARQLAPNADPVAAFAPVVTHVDANLGRRDVTDTQARMTTAYLVHPNGSGSLVRAVGCDGWDTATHRGVIGNWPPGVGDDRAATLCRELEAALSAGLCATPWAMVKRVAQCALETLALASHSVYGQLEVGVTFEGTDYYLPRTPCDRLVQLAEGPIARRFEELASLTPAAVCEFASRVLAVTIQDAQATWRGDHLYVNWVGDPKVRSVKIATSTSAQPAAGTGTTAEGNTGEYDTGAFTYTPLTLITVTPYSGAGATGVQGTPFYFKHRLPYIHTMFDHATGKPLKTTAFNDQGALLPFVSPTNFFSYATGGPALSQMWVSFGWTSQDLKRPDGSNATVPAPPSAPSAPSLSQTAGGALGARTRWAKVAYLKTDPVTGHETLYPVSSNSSFAISANNLLVVTALSDPGNGLYDGWAVLVGSASGSEYVQGTVAKQTFGVNWTEPAGGFSTTQNSLWTSSWKSLTKIGLDPSTAYHHYPYFDIAKNFVYIPAETNAKNASLSILQHGDGAMSLGRYDSTVGYSGDVSISTPIAASTSSGNAGGGRLM